MELKSISATLIRILGLSLALMASVSYAELTDCHDLDSEPTDAPVMSAQYFFRKNPYQSGLARAQASFIKSLGGDIRDDQVVIKSPEAAAKRYNDKVDQLIAQKRVDPELAIYWSLVYVDDLTGHLVFVRLGTPAPAGATLFDPLDYRIARVGPDGRNVYEKVNPNNRSDPLPSGILSDVDFLYAISQGHFPGTFSHELLGLNEGHLGMGEPAYLHELGHLGGFIEVPEGMMLFRKFVLDLIAKGGELSSKRYRRLFFANEMLLLMKPNAQSELVKFLRGFGIDQIDRRKIMARLAQFDERKMKTFRKALVAWHYEERLPFGGAIRSATMTPSVGARLDAIVLESLVLPETPYDLLSEIVDYIMAADALSRTTIQGWFDLASQETPLLPGSPYYRYLCDDETPVEYARYFCP